MHISPDFIGSSREIVEATYGGTAIFLQGASGDIGPMISYSADPASADRNGRMLGYAVCSAVESLLPPGTGLRYNGAIVSGATLAGWSEAPVKIAGAVGVLRSEVLAGAVVVEHVMVLRESDVLFGAEDWAYSGRVRGV